MSRFKNSLVFLVLLSTVLFPSNSVLAQNAAASADLDRYSRTQLDTSVSVEESNSVSQETEPTPVVNEEPTVTATPVVNEEPTITATPAVDEEPTVTATPVVDGEPTVTATPVMDGETTDGAASVVDGLTTDAANSAGKKVFLPLISNPQTTYYVSLSGNDSNPGTYNRPWRTIQKAANTVSAGYTVHILPGTYYEKFTPKNSGTSGAYITYTADSGTVVLDGSGVTLSTDSKGDGLVQIQGKKYIRVQNLTIRDSSVNCVNISDNSSGTASSYIDILNLNIQNCKEVGIRARKTNHLLIKNNQINHINYSSGIGVWFSSDVIVDGNSINNAHYYHECQGAHDEALTISNTDRFEVKNNTLDNTEANPPGFCSNADKLGIDVKESSQNGQVHHNTIRRMNAGAIYVDGWHAGANGTATLNRVNIYNNRISDGGGIVVGCEQPDGVVEYINIYNNLLLNVSFSGIQVRGAHGDGLRKNINILNNTIYGALPAGGNGGAGIYVTTANLGSNNGDSPVIIRNNISMFYFLSSGGGAVGQIRAANSTIASKITASHNLVSGPQECSSQYPNCVEVGSRITASASTVFVNPGAFDLHLKNNSPAINAGLVLGTVPHDLDGTARPQPAGSSHDIGAFEYVLK